MNDRDLVARLSDTQLVVSALAIYPRKIAQKILSDPNFLSRYELETDSKISFDNEPPNFSRSELFRAIRGVFSGGGGEQKLHDELGEQWVVCSEDGGTGVTICLIGEDRKFILDSFWPLIGDADLRLDTFAENADKSLYPLSAREYWNGKLSGEYLDDETVHELLDDLRDTPANCSTNIQEDIKSGKTSIKTLVPNSLRYYRRLIGVYESSGNINEYAANELAVHLKDFESLVTRRSIEIQLCTCMHSSISSSLSNSIGDIGALTSIVPELVHRANPISMIAAVEVLTKMITDPDTLIEIIAPICERLFRDDMENRFNLLSALIVLTDGEISRGGDWALFPPFYRRMASFSQANLALDCLLNTEVDLDKFAEWAMPQRGLQFYLQNYIDMRIEPRWLPEFATSNQLRAEVFGRLYHILKPLEHAFTSTESTELNDLARVFEIPTVVGLKAFVPGPLESGLNQEVMPEDVRKELEGELETEAPNTSTLVGHVNAIHFWKLEDELIKSITELLKNAQYNVRGIQDNQDLVFLIRGLANIAAVTRNPLLAKDILNLLRKYRDFFDFSLNIEQVLAAGLMAASSFGELPEWREYFGNWVSVLTSSAISKEASEIFLEWIEQVAIIEPSIYCTIGRSRVLLASEVA